MDRLRKAKGRVRGPQPDRRGRFRPPPPAPKSTKGLSLKYSSIEDAFEAVLDGADEFSNPLFDYDSEGHQQQQQGGGSRPTTGEGAWQDVAGPSPSSATETAGGRRAVSGARGKRGEGDFGDSGDSRVDPLLSKVVPKPISDLLFDEDSDRVDADSPALAAGHHHHNQPLSQAIPESSLVTSDSLFDDDEHLGRVVSTIVDNQLPDGIVSGSGSAKTDFLFDEDEHEHERRTVSTVTDHQDRLPDQVASGPSLARSDFLFDEEEDVHTREANPKVNRPGDETTMESMEPTTSHSDNRDLESLQQQPTTQPPQGEGVGVQGDPLCATAGDSNDEQGKAEKQEPVCETESRRGTFDEPGGNDDAAFTADPSDESRMRELSSSPSSGRESMEREETQVPSAVDETRTSLIPRLSETKIIVTCNDPEAPELPRPLRTSSPECCTDAVLLEADLGGRASKSSSEGPPSIEEGDLEAESKRDTLKLEDPLLRESPLSSSLDSGEHYLAGNPLENPSSTASEVTSIGGSSTAMLGLPSDAPARSPSVESGIGSSVEIPLARPRSGNENVLLFDASEHPLSPNTSYEERLPHAEETTAGLREQRDPLDSFVKVDKDDLFPIEEDYFTEEPSATQTGHITGRTSSSSKPSHPAVPPRPYQPPARPARPKLVKRNSAGKSPPPRPSYSPKLRHKEPSSSAAVQETAVDGQESRSDGAGVRVKLVQPLGHAPPPREGKSPLPSHDSRFTASTEVGPLAKERVHVPGSNRISLSSSAPDPSSLLTKRGSLTEHSHSQSKPDSPKPSAITESKSTSETATAAIETEQKEDVLFDEDNDKPQPDYQDLLLPNLPLKFLVSLSVPLYLHFSLNIFPYVSGFLAGFLLFYLTAGAALIYYVAIVEGGRGGEEEGKGRKSLSPRLSEEFVKRMNVDFSQLGGYKSNKFTATFHYDFATHHPSERTPAKVKLSKDFHLTLQVLYQLQQSRMPRTEQWDIRHCELALEPLEVAQNRKRRWSKKFPIRITLLEGQGKRGCSAFLFANTSRDKEDWFRRLKAASEGLTSDDLIEKQREFFSYMQHYLPTVGSGSSQSSAPGRRRGSPDPREPRRHGKAHSHRSSPPVQFSNRPESEEEMGSVSIGKMPRHTQAPYAAATAAAKRSVHSTGSVSSDLGTSVDLPQPSHAQATTKRPSHQRRIPSVNEDGFVVIPRAPKETHWINALAARLCWDIWHEERWKNWVTSRIQRKLIRVKTPSFMEKLQLTGVELGNDMPVINSLHRGPILDLRGVWAFLDVTYKGRFVMTIETKLKFGGKDEQEETGTEMVSVQHSHKSQSHSRSDSPSGPPRPKAPSHSQAARALSLGTPVDPEDEIDSGSESDGEGHTPVHYYEPEDSPVQGSPPSHPGGSSHDQEQHPTSKRERLMNMVSRLTKKVASTKFIRKAAEKVSSYPLVLTVEVNRLDGVLAVNIPPPLTDTVWYGFERDPHLELVAKPKFGQREVTFTHVTHWIENKLRELVNKKLVLPNMEDLVIPLLNSGLPEVDDKLSALASPSATK